MYEFQNEPFNTNQEEEETLGDQEIKGKSYSYPVIGHRGPEGSETSRLPHFLDNRLTDGRSWYSFLLEAESTPRAIVRLEGLGQMKNSVTSSGIEPATFRLVA
jgi:hypothetical protein